MSSSHKSEKEKRFVFNLHLDIAGLEGLSTSENEGKKFDVLWKRGSKKKNSGKTDRVTCKNGEVPSLGTFDLTIKLTPTSSSSSVAVTDPTKFYEAQHLSLKLRRLESSSTTSSSTSSSASLTVPGESNKKRYKPVTIGKAILNLSKFANLKQGEDTIEKVPMIGSKSPIQLLLKVSLQSESSTPTGPSSSSSSFTAELPKASSEDSQSSNRGSKILLSHSSTSDLKKKKSSLLKRTTSKLLGRSSSKKIDPSDLPSSSSASDLTESGSGSSISGGPNTGDISSLGGKHPYELEDSDLFPLVTDMIAILSSSPSSELPSLLTQSKAENTELYVSIYRSGKAIPLDVGDIRTAAFVLKIALNSRAQPLIPKISFDKLVKKNASSSSSIDSKIAYAKKILVHLPGETSMMTNIVLEFLHRISGGSPEVAHDLAAQFGETFSRDGDEATNAADLSAYFKRMAHATDALAFLITHYRQLMIPTHPADYGRHRVTLNDYVNESVVSSSPKSSRRSSHRLSRAISSTFLRTTGHKHYVFTLLFKSIQDGACLPSAPASGHSFLTIRWKRGKKSKNHGHTQPLDLASVHPISFPPSAVAKIETKMEISSKGHFSSKILELELVVQQDGASLFTLPFSLDFGEKLNVCLESGASDPVPSFSNDIILRFPPPSYSKTQTPLLILAELQAAPNSSASASSATSSSSSGRKRSGTSSSNLAGRVLDKYSPLYISLVHSILAARPQDELLVQDWVGVQILHSPIERRWLALSKHFLILFNSPSSDTFPSSADPYELIDLSTIPEVSVDSPDTDLSLKTHIGLVKLSLDTAAKRDQWIQELHKALPLAKAAVQFSSAPAIPSSSSSATDQPQLQSDGLTKSLQEKQEALDSLQTQLQLASSDLTSERSKASKAHQSAEKYKKLYSHQKKELQDLQKEIEAKRSEIEVARLELSSITTRCLNLQEQLDKTRQQNLDNENRSSEAADERIRELHDQISHLKKQLKNQTQDHAEIVSKLEVSFDQSKREAIEELNRIHLEQVNQLEQQIASHQDQTSKLQAEIESAHTLQISLQLQFDQLTADSTAQIEMLSQQLQAQTANLQAQLLSQEQSAKRSSEEAVSHLESTHHSEIVALQARLQSAEESHKNALEKLASDHQAELQVCSAAHQDKIYTLQAEHQAALQTLERGHADDIAHLESQHDEELAEIKQQLVSEENQQSAALKSLQGALKSAQEAHQHEIDDLKSQLASLQTDYDSVRVQQSESARLLAAEHTTQLEALRSQIVTHEANAASLSKQLLEAEASVISLTASQHVLEDSQHKELDTLREQLHAQQQLVQSSQQQLTESAATVESDGLLIAKLKAELEELNIQHLIKLRELEENHTRIILSLKEEHESKERDMKQTHADELSRLASQLKEQEERIHSDIESERSTRQSLEAEHQNTLAKLSQLETEGNHQARRSATQQDELDSLLKRAAELEDRLRKEQTEQETEIQQLTSKHQEVVDQLRSQIAAEVNTNQLSHQRIEQLELDLNEQQQRHVTLELENQEKLKQIQDQHLAELNPLKDTITALEQRNQSLDDSMKRLVEEHQQQLEVLQTSSMESQQNAIAALELKHAEEFSLLKETHLRRIQEFENQSQSTNADQMQHLRTISELEDKIESLKRAHRSELDRLKLQHDESVANLKSKSASSEHQLIETHHAAIAQLSDEHRESQSRLMLEAETEKTARRQLETDHEAALARITALESDLSSHSQSQLNLEEQIGQLQQDISHIETHSTDRLCEHQNTLAELNLQHQQQLDELRQQLSIQQHDSVEAGADLTKLRNELVEAQTRNDALITEHAQALSELRAAHQTQIESFEARISQLIADHDAQIKALNSEHQSVLAKLAQQQKTSSSSSSSSSDDSDDEKEDLRHAMFELEQQIEELKSSHQAEIAHLLSKHQEALESLKQELLTTQDKMRIEHAELLQEAHADAKAREEQLIQDIDAERSSRIAADAKLSSANETIARLQSENQPISKDQEEIHQTEVLELKHQIMELQERLASMASERRVAPPPSPNTSRREENKNLVAYEQEISNLNNQLHEQKVKHRAEIDELVAAHQEVLKSLTQQHEVLDSLDEQTHRAHAEALTSLKEDFRVREEELEAKLKAEEAHSAELADKVHALESSAHESPTQIEDLTNEIARLKESHRVELENLTAANEEIVKTLNQQHALLEDLDHQTQQAKLDAEIAKIKMELEEKFQNDLELQIKTREQSAQSSSQKESSRLKKLEGKIEELQEKVERKQEKIEKLQHKLDEATQSQKGISEGLLASHDFEKRLRTICRSQVTWNVKHQVTEALDFSRALTQAPLFGSPSTGRNLAIAIIEQFIELALMSSSNPDSSLKLGAVVLTTLEFFQDSAKVPSVSSQGLRYLVSPVTGGVGASSSSSPTPASHVLTPTPFQPDQSPEEWVRNQLDLIATKVLFDFFLTSIYGTLDQLSVGSIVFSDKFAIFESAGTSKNKTPGEDLSKYLGEVMNKLQAHHIFPKVAEDLLSAIFYRISSQVFNTLLASDHPDTVTIRRGFQIKMALSEIDSWAYRQSSSGQELSKLIPAKIQQHFSFIKSACMVIVFATNADIFENSDAVKDMFSPLTPHQILRILRRFHPDATAPEKVPPIVFTNVEKYASASGPQGELLLPPVLNFPSKK